jgi:hypothetical protein
MARFKIEDLPKGDFTVGSIAKKYYPECWGYDTEGRLYNRAIPTIYRLLRKMKMILEVGEGVFYNAL